MCGDNLSDDQILKQLNDILVNPQFEKWNTTSLEYVIGWATGFRGKTIRDLSLHIYDLFIDWYQEYQATHYIVPVYDFISNIDEMVHIRELLLQIDQSQFTDDPKHNMKKAINFMNQIDP
jgi:hypothetical protein